MKHEANLEKVRNLASAYKFKILFLITITLLSANTGFSNEIPPGESGARYITVGYKPMPAGVKGTGLTYGFGAVNKQKHFGIELYSAWMSTLPDNVEKIPAQFWGGGVKTGEAVISEPSWGMDVNIFIPIDKKVDLYFGPSLNFEKVANIYISDGSAAQMGGAYAGQRYADHNGTWQTRINGQIGVSVSFPTGYKGFYGTILGGYSIYRGITGGVGFSF